MGMRQRAKEGRWNGGKVLGYASVPDPADRRCHPGQPRLRREDPVREVQELVQQAPQRTKNRLLDGSVVIRRYYVCGNFRSKGVASAAPTASTPPP